MSVAVQEVVQDKTGALLTKLKEGVANLTNSDRWKEYLMVQARFHKYSAGNVMLIMAQRPDATRVAGFTKWRELGRYVKKGEHGIAIFAPVTYKVKATDAEDTNVEFTRLVGFKVVYTFDISQTDGKELPGHPSTILDVAGTESVMSRCVQSDRNKRELSGHPLNAQGQPPAALLRRVSFPAVSQPT